MKIIIDTKKSVEQNAQSYFEKGKQARKKLEGAKKALGISKKKLEKETKEKEQNLEKVKKEHKERAEQANRKQEWYEKKFRWFISSEDFLVLGGRDATTNEILIKKHTDKHDIVFHTDMSGSPFFVIKTEGKEPGEQTIQETADATLCFSKAWKMGLGTTPAFWVTPEQVSKEANPGEYVPKGAFMIRGKTNYVNPTADCAIGQLEDGRMMCAPTTAVKKHCEKTIMIIQGKKKASDIAKIVRKKIGGILDEIIKILPSGGLDIKE
ncbi:NFACT RNA binding domain-containing protein [Nanoarchaeota archaeon]